MERGAPGAIARGAPSASYIRIVVLRKRSGRGEIVVYGGRELLLSLEIKDFAIIDSLKLEFKEGLTVLTGETGAGKSIVVDAVDAVLGGRVTSDQVRFGASKARIDAVFDVGVGTDVQARLLELGVIDDETDGLLVISREIPAQGRTVVRLNGRPAPLSLSRDIGQDLVQIHGQHEHQALLKPQKHIDVLDAVAGQEAIVLRRQVRGLWKEMCDVKNQIAELSENTKERSRRLDILQFQLDEIRKAKIVPNEEEQLVREESMLRHAERLKAASEYTYGFLYGGLGNERSAYDVVEEARKEIDVAASIDEDFVPLLQQINDVSCTLQDIARTVKKRLDTVDWSSKRADWVRQRLDTLVTLKRKYGETLEDVLSYADSIAEEIKFLKEKDESVGELSRRQAEVKKNLAESSLALSAVRRGIIPDFETQVEEELKELGMPNASFAVSVSYEDDSDGIQFDGGRVEPGPDGIERIEFLFSANKGEPEKPLSRIASGGELSRVMLAIRSIAASFEDVPTVIFDEVDAGIGGATSAAVGTKLKTLGNKRQVICVTHLAPIAINASTHFYVFKTATGDRTVTDIKEVTGEARVLEVARMLGMRDPTPTLLKHAREMLAEIPGKVM